MVDVSTIANIIEKFAPLELQEAWDNCGFQVENSRDVKKILLALTITKDIINQAQNSGCDMIISHHPLFFVPFDFNIGIPIYSAHTNLDVVDGGTTDTIVDLLGYKNQKKVGNFLRVVELEKEVKLQDIILQCKEKLEIKNLRFVNNLNKKNIKTIAFCAGSGADFAGEAKFAGADVLVTGDIKYHSALEGDIILVDAGHFETERPVLYKINELLADLNLEVVIADEKSPFIYD